MPRADAERLAAWEAMRLAVARVETTLARRLDQERDEDLSEFQTLATLVQLNRSIRMHELAEIMAIGRPTATRICDRLERDGLVERIKSPQDGRAVHVSLTKAGRAEYRRCLASYERAVHDAFGKHLDELEVNALLRTLENLPES